MGVEFLLSIAKTHKHRNIQFVAERPTMGTKLGKVLKTGSGKPCSGTCTYPETATQIILGNKLRSNGNLRTSTDTDASNEFPRIGHTALCR